MQRKCKKCQKKKRERQFSLHHQPQPEKNFCFQVKPCTAKLIEPAKIIVHNDDYMLKEMHSARKKMKSMEKQISKLKSKLKKCEGQIKLSNHQNNELTRNISGLKKPKSDEFSQNEFIQRTETVANIRKREIGRFTNAEQKEHFQQEEQENMNHLQQTKIKKILRENNKNQILTDLKKSRKSKLSVLEYSLDNQEPVSKYFERQFSKKSSLLLSKHFQEDYEGYNKERLNHELQQFIIEEKVINILKQHTMNPIKKRSLRQEIATISRRLASIENEQY